MVPAGTILAFAFSVLSPTPQTLQASPDIYVSATDVSGSALCSAVKMVPENAPLISDDSAFANFPGGDAAPLRVYSSVFLFANISQSNTHPGMPNKISVQLATSVPLPSLYPASFIFIYNLSHAEAVAGPFPLGGPDKDEFRSMENPRPGFGTWDGSGDLVLQIHGGASRVGLIAGKIYRFDFMIMNPKPVRGQPSPRVYISAQIGSTDQWLGQTMSTPSGDASVLAIGSTFFFNLALSYQTNVPAFQNAINCSFSANVDLDAGTFVTISGIFGTRSVGVNVTQIFLVTGTRSTYMGIPVTWGGLPQGAISTYGVWRSVNGTLVVPVITAIPAYTNVYLSFVLLNGPIPQAGQIFFLSASYIAPVSFPQRALVIQTSAFTSRSLNQTSRFHSETNNITVFFSVNSQIPDYEAKNILVNAQYSIVFRPEVALQFSSNTLILVSFERTGSLNTIKMQPRSGLQAGTRYSFSFILGNPAPVTTTGFWAQSVLRYDVILSVQSSPPGAAAVTLIDSLGMPEDNRISIDSPRILNVLASQSSSFPGAANNIRVQFTLNYAPLQSSNPVIVVSNLCGLRTSSPATNIPLLDFASTGFLQTNGVLLTLTGGGSPECPAFAVNLQQQLIAGKQYSFSFVVVNGITAGSSTSFLSLNTTAGLFPRTPARSSATGVQPPPPASLCGQTTYTLCNVEIPCSCFSNDPISIMTPGFFFKSISQSTSRPGIGNRITVSVSTNVQVNEFLISGLVGSETKGFGLNLAYDQIVISDLGRGETVNAFSNLGWWTQESGTIKLLKLPASVVIEGTIFVFSFNLLNPNEGQEAPIISIAASYGVESRITTVMDTPAPAGYCDIETRPMHICSPTFLENAIYQETTGPGLPTKLTVTLRSNMRLDTTSKPILLIQLPANLFAETSAVISSILRSIYNLPVSEFPLGTL